LWKGCDREPTLSLRRHRRSGASEVAAGGEDAIIGYENRVLTANGAFAWIRKSSNPGVHVTMLALAVEQGVDWESQHAMEQVGA